MTFIAEAFLSGCISKVINDVKDYSWTKVKSVINNKNDRNLSTRIYRVIEKALIKVTDKKFKSTDILYEAIEKIFIEFRDHGNTIESVKCGLGMLNTDVTVERCENFLEKFYEGICQDEELHKVISLILQEKGIDINQKEFQQLNKTVEYGFDQLKRKVDKIDEKISINSKNNNEENLQNKKSIKSRTQEYVDKWEANMFLNDFDEWDENAGVNVKLCDVYNDDHLPHFIWKKNENISINLKNLLSRYIKCKKTNEMLLILGQPGIGKSTLITWITANFSDIIDDILVYKFASDLGNIDWQNISEKCNILYKLLSVLGLSYDELCGKVLILDGFDEINVGVNRTKIMNRLYWDFTKESLINNCSLIVTCRNNYIENVNKIKCNYIILQSWDAKQIRDFCVIFGNKISKSLTEDFIESISKRNEVFGIPLILYMVLALDISIEKEGYIVDIYDQIFSLEGGIYERCIKNISYEIPHRINVIKEQIHLISERIAFWMFENNSEKAFIPQKEYISICNTVKQEHKQKKEAIEQDFLIGNFFKLVKHCEGIDSEELYFVHRSMYEYFVAEIIYSSMIKAMNESVESLASVFGLLFKGNRLSVEILHYLKYKIENSNLKNLFNKVNEAFQLMLQDGMTYYTSDCYKNVIDRETCVFANMLEILHLVRRERYLLNFDKHIINYLRCSNFHLNLSYANLEHKNLYMVHLSKADLSFSSFRGSVLSKADLSDANLRFTSFKEADLYDANLKGAELSESILVKANLDGSIWMKDDIQKFLPELKKAFFSYIILEDNLGLCRKIVQRKELFID